MKGILADNDIIGHVAWLMQILQGNEWCEVWQSLDLSVKSFSDLGLSADSPDDLIWRRCQESELLLITGNRNRHEPGSLTATIEAFNTDQSWPVFTIADPKHFLRSKAYAERVAVRLLENLLDIDNLRGTGRMYLP